MGRGGGTAGIRGGLGGGGGAARISAYATKGLRGQRQMPLFSFQALLTSYWPTVFNDVEST